LSDVEPGARAFDPSLLPEALAELVAGATLRPISIGQSGSVVAFVDHPDQNLVVKLVERDGPAPALVPEAERVSWLAERFPAPRLVAHGRDESAEWLVTTALDGSDATTTPIAADPGRLASLLGEHLRRLHELDPGDCPFDASTASLVAHARSRVEAGQVDPAEFEPIHHGLTPEELLAHVESVAPEEPDDPVVTHGDYCLPNVVLRPDGSLAGLVDLGLLGVGDRYRDLGIGARSIAHNIGGGAVGAFIDGYGLDRPDLARLDAFVTIDDLF
jgi:aminoglycoside phosphotransferase